MLEIIIASFVENGASQSKSESRPSTAQRTKPQDILDISPASDRPSSPAEQRQNRLSSQPVKKSSYLILILWNAFSIFKEIVYIQTFIEGNPKIFNIAKAKFCIVWIPNFLILSLLRIQKGFRFFFNFPYSEFWSTRSSGKHCLFKYRNQFNMFI